MLGGTAPAVDGDWFIRTGVNGVWSSNVKHPASRKLLERAAKSPPTCLAFTAQDDWTLLDGANHILSSDVVPSIGNKALELAKAGHIFRWLAFTPQGGWVLLYDKNSYVADGLPQGARTRLDDAAKAAGLTPSLPAESFVTADADLHGRLDEARVCLELLHLRWPWPRLWRGHRAVR